MNKFTTYILIATAIIIMPSIYLPNHAPKNFILILFTTIAVQLHVIYNIKTKSKFVLSISILEIIIIIRLLWLIFSYRNLLTHPSNLNFLILLSLLFLTLLNRQVDVHKQDITNYNIYIHFLRSIWLVGLLQALIGFLQFYQFAEIPDQFLKTAMIGTIGSANGFGIFLSISMIALSYDYKISSSRNRKIIFILLEIIMFTALILNGSRGAIFSLAIAFIVWVLLHFFVTNIKKTMKINRFPILLTIFLSFLGFTVFLYRLNPESSFGRFMVWNISFPMFIDHPFLGLGQGRFAVEYLNYQSIFFSNPKNLFLAYKASNLKQAHNEFLQAVCEGGLFGGGLFITIWFFAIYNLIKQIRIHADRRDFYVVLLLILVAIISHSLIDTPLHVLPVSVIAYSIIGFIPVYPSTIYLWVKSKRILISIIILITIFMIFSCHKVIKQYLGHYFWQKGIEFAELKNWKYANQNYKTALKYLPNKGELEFHYGSALVLSGSYSSGIIHLKRAMHDFNDRNIYLSLSYAYLKLNELKKAEQNAHTALSMFPDHLTPHLLLGEIYYKQGKFAKSKASLKKCINRETYFQSTATELISRDAKILWQNFYNN